MGPRRSSGARTGLVLRDGLYGQLYRQQLSGGAVEPVCANGLVLAEAAGGE